MSYTYAFVGLTPSERALLESIFALDAAEGEDVARVRKPEQADLLIVNGDDPAVVRQLRQANPGALVVLVGRPAGADLRGLPALQRPLDMAGVVRVLSGLDWPDARRSQPGDFGGTFAPSSLPPTQPGAMAPARPPMPRSTQPNTLPNTLPSTHPSTQPPPPARSAAATGPASDPMAFAPTTASAPLHITAPPAVPSRPAPPPAPPATVPQPVSARATWATPERASGAAALRPESGFQGLPDDADADVMVVVGPLGPKRHTLSLGLRRLGYRVRVVEGADRARQLLAQQPAAFVFMDQLSLGEQLTPLARALSAQRAARDGAPHLVVVARQGGLFERLRLRALGCVWMVAPLQRDRLVEFLARRGLVARA